MPTERGRPLGWHPADATLGLMSWVRRAGHALRGFPRHTLWLCGFGAAAVGCRWNYDLIDKDRLGASTGGSAPDAPIGNGGIAAAGSPADLGGETAIGGSNAAGGAASIQPQLGLLGFWAFDEGAGAVAVDQERGHDGSLINEVRWVPGRVGSAIRTTETEPGSNLPSSSAVFVQVGNVSYGRLTGITLSLWLRNLGGASSTGGLVSHVSRFGEAFEGGYSLGYAAGRLQWTLADPATATATLVSVMGLTDPVWQHIAATWDAATATAAIYRDGERIETWTHAALDLGTGPWPLKFGQTTINEAEFEGELDQIRIYDRALTEQEIVQLAGESQ